MPSPQLTMSSPLIVEPLALKPKRAKVPKDSPVLPGLLLPSRTMRGLPEKPLCEVPSITTGLKMFGKGDPAAGLMVNDPFVSIEGLILNWITLGLEAEVVLKLALVMASRRVVTPGVVPFGSSAVVLTV